MTEAIKTIAPVRKSEHSAALMAELNAELRGRDPYEILRRQVRNATLDELERRAKTDLGALAEAPPARRILRILAEMRVGG
jgi:hypothetical protein